VVKRLPAIFCRGIRFVQKTRYEEPKKGEASKKKMDMGGPKFRDPVVKIVELAKLHLLTMKAMKAMEEGQS
jgi:hypothetical protein